RLGAEGRPRRRPAPHHRLVPRHARRPRRRAGRLIWMSATAEPRPDLEVVVIGAGPAGLTAAAELVAAGVPATVVEADSVVGGISRTVEREGWRFDIGGHRFFTKV